MSTENISNVEMEKDVSKILQVLGELNTESDQKIGWSTFIWPETDSSKVMIWFVAVPFILAFSLGASSRWITLPELAKLIGLLLIVICLLGIIVGFSMMVLESRKDLQRIIKNPLVFRIGNIEKNSIASLKFSEKLENIRPKAIEVVLKQVTQERSSFERTIGLLVGAVEKVGIIPGILALVYSIQRLLGTTNMDIDFVYFLQISLIGIYLVAFYAYPYITRLDKYISFLETSKELRSDETKQGTSSANLAA